MEKNLAGAIEDHRAQIKKSLRSRDGTERKLAESIAEWWEVDQDPVTKSCNRVAPSVSDSG